MRLNSEDLIRIRQQPGYAIASDTRKAAPYTDPVKPARVARPVVQELETDPLEQAADADEAGVSNMDGQCRPKFRLSVVLRISDERHRDNDGAFTTLADCLVSAVGRLAEVDPGTQRKHANSVHRK